MCVSASVWRVWCMQANGTDVDRCGGAEKTEHTTISHDHAFGHQFLRQHIGMIDKYHNKETGLWENAIKWSIL